VTEKAYIIVERLEILKFNMNRMILKKIGGKQILIFICTLNFVINPANLIFYNSEKFDEFTFIFNLLLLINIYYIFKRKHWARNLYFGLNILIALIILFICGGALIEDGSEGIITLFLIALGYLVIGWIGLLFRAVSTFFNSSPELQNQ
jgi:hypothetical protein